MGISQTQITQYQLEPDHSYRGCTVPVRMDPALIYTPQVIQHVETSKDVLDITDPEMSTISAAPNPTRGAISVTVSPALIGHEIQVIDMTGRVVGAPVQITGVTENIMLEGKSGVYLISIKTDRQVITERILLNKE